MVVRTVLHLLSSSHLEHLRVVTRALDTPKKLQDVEQKVLDVLDTQQFQGGAVDEIKNLRQNIIDIKAGFSTVRNDLWKFDCNGFVDENGQKLRLHDDWVGYEQKFVTLVNRSQSAATRAATMLQDISWTVLDRTDKTLKVEDVLDALDDFAAKIEVEEKTADGLRLDFETLSTEVETYAKRIKTTAAAVQHDAPDVVADIKKQLDDAIASLNETQSKIKSLMAMTLLTAVLGGGMLVLACILCPAVAAPAFAAIMGAAATCKEAMDAKRLQKQQQRTVTKLTHQLENEETKLEWIREYLGDMSKTEKTIEGMTVKLKAISHIWLVIQQDMVGLAQHIKNLVPADKRAKTKFNSIWDKRVTSFRASAQALIPILLAYAKETKDV